MIKFKALCLQAGFADGSGSGLAKELAGAVKFEWAQLDKNGPPARCVAESDAPTVLALFQDLRVKSPRQTRTKEGGGKNDRPLAGNASAPIPVVPPPQAPQKIEMPAVAPKPVSSPPKSNEVLFNEHCRALIHLCRLLDDDREVTINKDGAEFAKTIRVSKTEKISG